MFILLRPKKKKMFVCPFPTDPKFWKTWVAFFFFFFYLNFAFLNKIVKIKFSKCIVTVPKVYCVGTESVCIYPIHVSTRLFDVIYSNTENYLIYIAFLQHPDLKKKKKKKKKKKRSTYRPSQFSGQKGKQTFIFFRPYQCCIYKSLTHTTLKFGVENSKLDNIFLRIYLKNYLSNT